MLQLTPLSVIFVASCYVDFRKGIDGLAAFCKNTFVLDPLNGSLFLFYNKSRTTIKILAYDGQGFVLFIKRLSKGTFKANPAQDFLGKNTASSGKGCNNNCIQICHRLLGVLINNGDPLTISFAKDWKSLRSN
jgi:transposase